jgi:hypothetical protein
VLFVHVSASTAQFTSRTAPMGYGRPLGQSV